MTQTFSDLGEEMGQQTPGQERPPSEADVERQGEEQRKWMAETRHAIEEQVRRKPYQMVLAAAGVGYVLGGGIPSWALRAVVHAGSRALIARALGPALGAALKSADEHNINLEES